MKLTRELMLEIKSKLDEFVKEQSGEKIDNFIIDFEGDFQVTLQETGDILFINPEEL